MFDMEDMLLASENIDSDTQIVITENSDDGIDDYLMDDFWERIAG